MPPLFYYPGYDYEEDVQRAPVKTISMLGSLAVSTLVSYLMHRLWLAGKLSGKRDLLKCMGRQPSKSIAVPRSIVIETEDLEATADASDDHISEKEATNLNAINSASIEKTKEAEISLANNENGNA